MDGGTVSNDLERLADATRALAGVSTASEAWQLARAAAAARHYAKMRGLGHEAINYATGIKAQAMLMLADFVDAGQANGTIRTAEQGRPKSVGDAHTYSLPELLDTDSATARDAVREARRLREHVTAADVDELVAEANSKGEDLGIRGLRRAAAAKRRPAGVPDPIPPRPGRYRCIVIDPPWPMAKIDRDERPDQGVELAYPVMTLDQIADETWVPLRSMADDDCHLYLWVTHKYLPAGLDLLDAWGFRYQCVMTWVKNVGITPFSWMYDTEHVLFARRGNLKLTRKGLRLHFAAPVTGHSVKPDVFYERVTQASPGPRVDMFARRPREGFDVWGNEVTVA